MKSLHTLEHRDTVLELIEEAQQLLHHICHCYHASEPKGTQNDLLQAALIAHDVFARLDRYALYLSLHANANEIKNEQSP